MFSLHSATLIQYNLSYADMGLALTVDQFHELADRVRSAGVKFIIEPHLRFEGLPGEQYTMFFKDPSGTFCPSVELMWRSPATDNVVSLVLLTLKLVHPIQRQQSRVQSNDKF